MATSKKETTALKTASVLAFERKLDPSDGHFSAGQWDNRATGADWQVIGVHDKSIRGTISNRMKAKGDAIAKVDNDIKNPNLQHVDVAALPPESDTLRVRFTLRVLGGAGHPSACNDAGYQRKLESVVNAYKNEVGFSELAMRYATNVANGRFLWRNRMSSEQIEVRVNHLREGQVIKSWTFNALELSLREFDGGKHAGLKELASVIEAALNGSAYGLLEIVAFARMGAGQEVFPSQELILDKGKNDKSKTLYRWGDAAALHSQKIGNALRTIDTWYPDPEGDDVGPIAAEPYGSVTSRGKAYRKPGKDDFYTLLDNWVLRDQAPARDQQHYVMANLVRGGVFGEAEEK